MSGERPPPTVQARIGLAYGELRKLAKAAGQAEARNQFANLARIKRLIVEKQEEIRSLKESGTYRHVKSDEQ